MSFWNHVSLLPFPFQSLCFPLAAPGFVPSSCSAPCCPLKCRWCFSHAGDSEREVGGLHASDIWRKKEKTVTSNQSLLGTDVHIGAVYVGRKLTLCHSRAVGRCASSPPSGHTVPPPSSPCPPPLHQRQLSPPPPSADTPHLQTRHAERCSFASDFNFFF